MKKLFLLISLWCCYSMLSGSFAQTVFLEDFNEGSTFPEGWEVNAAWETFSKFRIANSTWCLRDSGELNIHYYSFWDLKSLPDRRIEFISPILGKLDYEQLNFSMDFYRQEYDEINSEIPILLYAKNDHMEEWQEQYVHPYSLWDSLMQSKPFICSIDSSIFRYEGFQFMIVLDEEWCPVSDSHHWINIDNIKIEVAPHKDLALFDHYPALHIPQDSLFSPKARFVNKGMETANGKVRCTIREHKSHELVYDETVDIPEMERMDTLNIEFQAFNLPYKNHLYHLTFELESEGDENQANNLVNFDVDTYSTPFHNWLGLNLFYSTEYSNGLFERGCYYYLKQSLDTFDLIKGAMPKACAVNYIYDDVPDSKDCQVAVAYMNDHGIKYAPTELFYRGEIAAYIPRFSLFPRQMFRPFEYKYYTIKEMSYYYRSIENFRAPFTLDIYGTHSGLDYSVMVELTPKAPFINDRLKLRTVITRSHVPSNANPDIYEDYRVEYFDDVVQMALPDTNGIAFAMDGSETSSKQWEMSFSLKDFWDPEQVKIVTYVQDTFNYDIIQCKAVNLLDLWGVGVGEPAQSPAESILITPNPAKDVLYAQLELEMPANILFRLRDLNGRDLGILKETFLGAGKHNVSIQLPESIKSGIYILQTETGRQSYSQKLNVLR